MITPGRLTALDPWLLALALSWRLLIVTALAVGIGYVIWRLFRRYGAATILRVVAPLAVALTVVGCEALVGHPEPQRGHRFPLHSQVATVSGDDAASAADEIEAITWDDLREGRATMTSPRWRSVAPDEALSAATTTMTPAQASAVDDARGLYPGMNAAAGNLLAAAWIDPPVGEVRDWGGWLQRWHGPLSGRPGLTGAAAEADHRASAGQTHGQAVGGLDLCAAHIATLRSYFAVRPVDPRTWWPRDDRLARVSAACAHAFAASEPSQPVATACGVVGWSGGPLPDSCDEWVTAGPSPACCWQRVARGRDLVTRCSRACDGATPADPPPPPPVEPPPPEPDPPATCDRALDALAVATVAVDSACRPAAQSSEAPAQ
jgi:hypothetical protein